MTPDDRLKSLGLALPPVESPIANYVLYKKQGDVVYISGQGPRKPDGSTYSGIVGVDVTWQEAYDHAKLVGLQILAIAAQAAGGLSNVEMLKLFGMVHAAPDFAMHPQVINGCSDLLVDVLGEAGKHSRSAVGMGSLPRNMTVEIEAILLVRKK